MADKLTFEQWWETQDIFKSGTIDDLARAIWTAAQENMVAPEPEPEYKFKKCEFDYQWEALKEFEEGAEFYWHYHDEGRFVKCLIGKDVLISDSDDNLFRRTPIRTKTAVYPMPETEAPEVGTEYSFASSNGGFGWDNWRNSTLDNARLAAGNVFLKREHAQDKDDAQAVEVTE